MQFPMNLRPTLAAALFAVLPLVFGASAGEPRLIWETHLNPDRPAIADSIAELALDAQANSFVIGTTGNLDGLSSALLARYNPAGAAQWTAVTSAGGPRFTRGNALALDHSGHPIMVATSRQADGTDGQLIVMKWSAAGDFLYSALINQPAGTSGKGVAVAVDSSDHFYVLANHHPLGTTADQQTTAYLRKYTPDGQPEWALPLTRSDSQFTQAFAMKLDPAGHVIVTGKAVLFSPVAALPQQTACATFKVSPQGAVLWSDTYARTTRGDNHGTAIATDAQGNVYVTGVSSSPHSGTLTDVTTLKYAGTTGARVWVSNFDAIEQASDTLGLRSFAGTSIVVEDNGYVWVGCRPYVLLRLSISDGSNSGFAYSAYSADSGVEASIDRLLLLEPGRGLLHTGSISDASSVNDLYVQHVDGSLNSGWSFRFHPEGTQGSQIVGFARGPNDQLNFAANYVPSTGEPASDGVLFAIAPQAVPTVQVRAIRPVAREPFKKRPAIHGRFRIQLSSPTEEDLRVNYTLDGTADWDTDDGADYLLPTPDLGSVVIPKGQRHVDLIITPLADNLREPRESVNLTLQPTSQPTLSDYQLGPRVSATVWILDRRR
jgi:hypothetical protein